jgi:acyl-coenzyme A synthetase/AMP-(fatty) acid ligase
MSPPLPRDYNAAVDFIDRHVPEGRASKRAFVDDERALTYAELAEQVARAGSAFLGMGVQPEQRVALCMLDSVDFPCVFWGAIKAGAVPVPLNTLLTTPDYAFMLRDCRARVLVVSDALNEKVAPAAAASPFLRRVVKTSELAQLLAAASPHLDAAATCPDDVAFWLYSSGSTGAPKGAVHLHSHLVQTAALYARRARHARGRRRLLRREALLRLRPRQRADLPAPRRRDGRPDGRAPDAAAVMRTMRDEPTIFGGVPTLFASHARRPALDRAAGSPRAARQHLRRRGAARHVGEKWRERFGCDILDGIGSTEMLHIFLSNRPATCATARPGAGPRLRRRARRRRRRARRRRRGRRALGARAPACAGYWNQREKSRAHVPRPVDAHRRRYTRDADGYYTYCGRSDDMLKVGGIWVSPFEVESRADRAPACSRPPSSGTPTPTGWSSRRPSSC